MKIGIITFHRAINYGAVLQTLGLQKALEQINYDVEVIDYRCKQIEDDYKNFKIGSNVIKDLVKSTLLYSVRSRKKRKFEEFNNKYLNLSKDVYRTYEDLLKANNEYDVFITGSDQVWDNKCAGFDKAYFLGFVEEPKKKNSYAASFSFGEIPNGMKDEYKKRLEDFNKISVREEKGRKIFGELLSNEIRVDLDPTLLLKSEEWDKYASKNEEKEKYILLYNVNAPKNLFEYAEKLSKDTGYKIIYISDSPVKKINAEYRKGISPSDYLALFKNAEYVLTNSFHGTVFSLMFEKKFIVELESINGKVNHRSKNLLNMLNLDNRILDGLDNRNCYNQINYREVNKILDRKRNESIKYLREIVKNEN